MTIMSKGVGWLAALQLSSTYFSHVEAEMLKTPMFFTCFIFGRHFQSFILYCVGQFKIQKMRFSWGETSLFFALEKSLEFVFWDNNFHAQSKSCGSAVYFSIFFNSAISTSEVLPRWKRKWLHCAAIGSVAPIANGFRCFLHGFCILGKSDCLPDFQNFQCGVYLLGSANNKAIVELHSSFFLKLLSCVRTFVYLSMTHLWKCMRSQGQ